MASNRDRFLRLSKARVEKTIKQIELIGNMSDKTNYSYEDQEMEAIFQQLDKALNQAKDKFKSKRKIKNLSLPKGI